MKKQKYILEKLYKDYKNAFADWTVAITKSQIKEGYYDLKDIYKKIEWKNKFYKQNKKMLDKVDKTERKFLNKINPKLFKSYLGYLKMINFF